MNFNKLNIILSKSNFSGKSREVSENEVKSLQSLTVYKFSNQMIEFLSLMSEFSRTDIDADLIVECEGNNLVIEMVPIMRFGDGFNLYYNQFYDLLNPKSKVMKITTNEFVPMFFSSSFTNNSDDVFSFVGIDRYSGKIIETEFDKRNYRIISDSFDEFFNKLKYSGDDYRYIKENKLEYDNLLSKGYRFVENPYIGGDNDFIIVDKDNNKFTYFENGRYPFYDLRILNKSYKNYNIEDLIKVR